jgi:hypothetical protein
MADEKPRVTLPSSANEPQHDLGTGWGATVPFRTVDVGDGNVAHVLFVHAG